jgi:hypothetical protein
MDNKDNPLYTFSLTQEDACIQPDIYFDDPVEEVKDNYLLARVIITQLLESSSNMQSLQILMCLFAGLSLRESSKICNVSHEHCRKILEMTKQTHPELYSVIKSQRYTVQSLVPTLINKRYTVTDLTNSQKKESHYSSVKAIAKKYDVTTGSIYVHMYRGSKVPIDKRIIVKKNNKE